jgi:hypothetical protein
MEQNCTVVKLLTYNLNGHILNFGHGIGYLDVTWITLSQQYLTP